MQSSREKAGRVILRDLLHRQVSAFLRHLEATAKERSGLPIPLLQRFGADPLPAERGLSIHQDYQLKFSIASQPQKTERSMQADSPECGGDREIIGHSFFLRKAFPLELRHILSLSIPAVHSLPDISISMQVIIPSAMVFLQQLTTALIGRICAISIRLRFSNSFRTVIRRMDLFHLSTFATQS